jgi:hypothetical protein
LEGLVNRVRWRGDLLPAGLLEWPRDRRHSLSRRSQYPTRMLVRDPALSIRRTLLRGIPRAATNLLRERELVN